MDEDPLLLKTEKGLTALYKGIHLYPPENPLGYARRRALAAEIPPGSLLFVPSVGLGHGLADLLPRLPEGAAILCVEIDQKLMALASTLGLPRDPRLTIIRTESQEAIATVLARMGTRRFRRVVNVPLSAGYRLDPAFYERSLALLVAEIRTYWQNRMTLIGMGNLWVRNLFENMPLLARSTDLQALSTELPVVVAGAGPSLEAGIPFMRKLREKVFLVAVDTALPVLAGFSLKPDLVVVLEAQAHNQADFLPFHDPWLPVACELSSFPPGLRLFPDSLFTFSSAFAPLQLFQRLKDHGILPCPLPPLGSVGVAAVYAALRMTRREVVLTGLDFSYPGGGTHSRGSPVHLAMLSRANRLRAVGQDACSSYLERPRIRERDSRGRTVTTDLVLRSYRDQLARTLEGDSGRILDVRETGLNLGVLPSSIEEAEDRVSSSQGKGERLHIERGGVADAAEIRSFIENERTRLLESKEAASDILASGASEPLSASAQDIIRGVDYAYLHFPDEPDLQLPGRSFLARAIVAFQYYSQRLGRVLSRM
jgi:hypothetical protein